MKTKEITFELIYQFGEDVFEDREYFIEWLTLPCRNLANKKPVELLDSGMGRLEVYNALGRIEYGIFG
ncbi:MbcA/ParS/Xre antitoxin family protein [Reichenbachiella faecimaris]|uniref:MbcA/ParS/Xre antitoxin family protein n=1 Tax=Reichenbachiella faecimaris TaxID=692418 RepID=UPI0009FDDAAC|nr:MbcA/ParS/Xre antitoxin family protein [Reichenbachiella faecimaris]